MEQILGFVSLAIQYWPAIKAVLALVGKFQDAGHDDPVEAAAAAIRSLHKMTPEEEQAWFDRASNPYAGGA